jgi:hypothetical protein
MYFNRLLKCLPSAFIFRGRLGIRDHHHVAKGSVQRRYQTSEIG